MGGRTCEEGGSHPGALMEAPQVRGEGDMTWMEETLRGKGVEEEDGEEGGRGKYMTLTEETQRLRGEDGEVGEAGGREMEGDMTLTEEILRLRGEDGEGGEGGRREMEEGKI